MEYKLKNTIVYPDGSVVNALSPVLTPEERERREHYLHKAAERFAKNLNTTEAQMR